MSIFEQTTTIHTWILYLMFVVVVLSIVQNVLKIIEEHHRKKLRRAGKSDA